MLKNLLLSLLLLPTLVMANPPPAGNWLESLFAEQHWDLRLKIKLIDITNYVSKVTVPEMGCPILESCGHFSSSVFASLENGEIPKLEEIVRTEQGFLDPSDVTETPTLLTRMIGKRTAQINYSYESSAFEFIKNNIGKGDHVILTLDIINESTTEKHAFNVVNLDGKLTVIDTAQRIDGKHLMQELDEVLARGKVGRFKIDKHSDYIIDFAIRDNRTYDFPVDKVDTSHNGGELAQADNGVTINITGVHSSDTIKADLDQMNACPIEVFP